MYYTLANFSSVFEIAFAFNAIMVIFELQKLLEKKFKKIQKIGNIELKSTLHKSDYKYISNYNWKGLAFKYVLLIGRLKIFAFLNSTIALCLLIISGFNPDFRMQMLILIIILIMLFLPILYITYLISYKLKKEKIVSLYTAVDNLIETSQEFNEEDLDNIRKDYYSVIKVIELTNLMLFLIKKEGKSKLFNSFERYTILCETKKYKNKSLIEK